MTGPKTGSRSITAGNSHFILPSMPRRRRFPRIPKSADVGKTARRAWKSPRFFVRPLKNVTEFVHQLPFNIPDRIRKKQLAIFMALFTTQTVDVGQELEAAYKKATYKGIPVRRLIRRALRKVFNDAIMVIFSKAKKSGDKYAKDLKGGRKSFAKAARPRRTPDTKFRNRRAMRLASLYEKISPSARQIRIFVQEHRGQQSEEDLRRLVEERFRSSWVRHITQGQALAHLPEIPGYERTATLGNLRWTARQLTVGIIWCIENKNKVQPQLSANTILEDYLPLGRQLLEKQAARR
jgi:hypothetical protein